MTADTVEALRVRTDRRVVLAIEVTGDAPRLGGLADGVGYWGRGGTAAEYQGDDNSKTGTHDPRLPRRAHQSQSLAPKAS